VIPTLIAIRPVLMSNYDARAGVRGREFGCFAIHRRHDGALPASDARPGASVAAERGLDSRLQILLRDSSVIPAEAGIHRQLNLVAHDEHGQV